LASAYEDLLILESELTRERLAVELTAEELQRMPAIRQPHNVRFYQLLSALNQVVTADPASTQARGRLAYWYSRAGQWDLALEQYEALLPLLHDPEEQSRTREAIVRLTDQVERIRADLEEQRRRDELATDQGSDFALARLARERGCPKLALQYIEGQSYGVLDPNIELALAHIYTEIGQPVPAFEKLRPVVDYEAELGPKFNEVLGTTFLLQGNYSSARGRWLRAIESERVQTASSYVFTLRNLFAQANPLPFFQQADQAVQQPLRNASGLLHLGMLLMEAGQVEEAAERFRESLEVEPDAPFRVLAAFYLNRLTDEGVDPYRPSDYVPMEFEGLAEAP
jgi:tetratricopeptide (TPR) repeat protein